mgnify:FL=1
MGYGMRQTRGYGAYIRAMNSLITLLTEAKWAGVRDIQLL